MDVICSGCGRVYEYTRFAGGRTFHCACGTHVQGPVATRPFSADQAPLFFADAMLGGLARWLRMLGFDAAHQHHINDAELVRRTVAERRLLLTRDRRLAREWRVEGILRLDSDQPLAQLAEVDRRIALARFARPFTRCSRCNTVLVKTPVAELADRVPEQIRRAGADVACCPRCGRVYWEGSHTDRMRRTLCATLQSLSGRGNAGD